MGSDNTQKLLKLSLLIFECFMALAYVGMSIVLLVPLLKVNIQSGLRIGLGVILGLYGLFRVFRAYKKLTLKDE